MAMHERAGRFIKPLADGAANALEILNREDGMFIFRRRASQGIVISGNIVVKVLHLEGDRATITVTAPEGVTVERQELHELHQLHQQRENEDVKKR